MANTEADTPAVVIARCKEKAQAFLNSEDARIVANGGVVMKHKKAEHPMDSFDCVSITVGMYNKGLPELFFVYGPPLHNETLISDALHEKLRANVDRILNTVQELSEPEQIATFFKNNRILYGTEGEMFCLRDLDSPDLVHKLPIFCRGYLYLTVALRNSIDFKKWAIVYVPEDVKAKPDYTLQ